LTPDLIHDLRTPLNQIIGYSEMLVERAAEVGQDDLVPDLEKVCGAGRRLLGIIEANFEATALPVANGDRVLEAPVVEASSRSHLEVEAGPDDAKGLLLVVDDDEGNRDVLSRRLEKQGYTVATAENGRQALEMLEANPYDLVLLDIMMPEVDGYEVLRSLKADERLRHVPVIMISALNEMESVARCIEMGADDYLTKPFNRTLLKARLGACLEKKRGRDREMDLFEQLQQNYKRLQDLEGLREDLTHMIVHDLRTPLTSVMAALQTFEVVGELNADQREVLDISVTGSSALLGMINSLLDVEKFESGAMDLDYSLLSVEQLVASAVGQVYALAQAKNLTLDQELGPDLPWLNGDENKLQRVLVNLLGNAVKFTPAGGVITVQVGLSESSQCVEFCVQDTGEGIPPEAFERIFEKFGQVASRASGRAMSTGLGLTFCKLAVEAHGGQIGVESSLTEGSRFCFTIPLSQPAL
jgi:signal transduction histidine kinase